MFGAALLLSLACALDASASPALPDVASLLREVEAHQQQLDRARENYTFHETVSLVMLDKKGKVRSTETDEYHDFFVHGQEVRTLIAKNGKPLNPADTKKEQDRAAKEAEKYENKREGAPDKDEISVSRLLQLVTFSNPRRVDLNGRAAIAADFTGNPHAKTHSRTEDAMKRVSGTLWIDAAAREVARLDATFDDNLRLGFGLLATVEKGSHFSFAQALIHNEAWLPTTVQGHFDAKALMFVGLHLNLTIRYDDYRRFNASATEQPGVVIREAH